MKRVALLAAASGMAVLAAAPASAAIFISYSTNGGATKTNLVTDTTGNASYTSPAVAGYTLNLSATGMPVLTSPNFSTTSISVQSNNQVANQLILYFTQTDQTAYNGALNTSFSVTRVTNPAQSINLATYYSATNANGSVTGVAPGTLLAQQTFTSNADYTQNSFVVIPSLFSTTAVYTLNFGAGTGGRINAGADVTSAVPEPATWGMMIVGFGLMGGVLRRRSTKVAFA